MVACSKARAVEGIFSSETGLQFAGIINQQIYHKWFTVAQIISSNYLNTCFFIPPRCHHFVESYLKFYYYYLNCLFLIRLYLSKVAEKGNISEISVFYSEDIVAWRCLLTWHRCLTKVTIFKKYIAPLNRTGMLIKIRRAIVVELLSPWGPNLESPQTPTSPSNNPIFLENSILKRVCPILVGEVKSSSPSSYTEK